MTAPSQATRMPDSMADILAQRVPCQPGDTSLSWHPEAPQGPFDEDGPDLRPAHALTPDGTWTPRLDAFLLRLVHDYGVFAPSVFLPLSGGAFPWLPAAAAQSPPITWSLHKALGPNDWSGSVTALVFSRMMALGDWRRPARTCCPLCGSLFDPEALHPPHVIAYGPPRWCPPCCGLGRGTVPASREEALAGIRHYAVVNGTPPMSGWADGAIAPSLSGPQRDEVLASRMAMPHDEVLVDLGLKPWGAVLEEVELLPAGELRTTRGVMSRAADGHWCRSLMERTVDDFLFQHGIDHEPEPSWPFHQQHNANNRKRADWRLPDGTFVEAAGLLSDTAYADRMRVKQQLAEEMGVPLIVLRPLDLLRLDLVFSPWLRAEGRH